jgi:hypothetical protein
MITTPDEHVCKPAGDLQAMSMNIPSCRRSSAMVVIQATAAWTSVLREVREFKGGDGVKGCEGG